jgi:deazaflavin-dependent oxidoreductase (nitroreductase family)
VVIFCVGQGKRFAREQLVSMPDDIQAFNRSVVEEFRANNGEMTNDMLRGSRLVLLTTTGAKSGRLRTTPLGYFTDGPNRVILWASNMAAPAHPAWYHNLCANPDVTVEVKTEAGVECFDGKATTAQGQEHDRLLGILNATLPHMAEHQHKTEREIPSSSSSAKTDRSRSPRTA